MTDRPISPPLRVVLCEWQTDEEFRRSLTAPVTLIPSPTLRDEDVAPLLRDADVLISKRFTAGMAAGANALRLIQITGAGMNQIDFAAVPPGAVVCNCYGHAAAITEYVMMAILALNRDLLNMDMRIRRGEWSDRLPRGPHGEVRGRTLAVIGLGEIGREVVRVAGVFGMRVVGVTRNPVGYSADDLGLAELAGLDELRRVLGEADFVVLAVPLDANTHGLIGVEELRAMRAGAFLVNVARGEIIDEAALYEALRERAIAGAAIDVWYQYPEVGEELQPSRLPFHELDNVMMTPHIAGWTEGTFRHRWQVMDQNFHRLMAGEPLLHVVSPPPVIPSAPPTF